MAAAASAGSAASWTSGPGAGGRAGAERAPRRAPPLLSRSKVCGPPLGAARPGLQLAGQGGGGRAWPAPGSAAAEAGGGARAGPPRRPESARPLRPAGAEWGAVRGGTYGPSRSRSAARFRICESQSAALSCQPTEMLRYSEDVCVWKHVLADFCLTDVCLLCHCYFSPGMRSNISIRREQHAFTSAVPSSSSVLGTAPPWSPDLRKRSQKDLEVLASLESQRSNHRMSTHVYKIFTHQNTLKKTHNPKKINQN
uniref:uncharacterized protein LOC118547663 n=1 Tax=Halichoerus grypus TaxID=9711 RepID=UPI0016598CBF|nr:uncharacterized protein LOC118547663 [Halichoerus grypus]